jgi:hypothetical protein
MQINLTHLFVGNRKCFCVHNVLLRNDEKVKACFRFYIFERDEILKHKQKL